MMARPIQRQDEDEEYQGDFGEMLPNQIVTDPKFAIRRFRADGEEDDLTIHELAADIEANGQIDPVVLVYYNGGPKLIAGHRRTRAITLINEKRSACSQPLLRVKYRIDREPGDPLRKALSSNLQREDMSPMDHALAIERCRNEYQWHKTSKNNRNTDKLAEYFSKSRTWIQEHEKLLTGTPEMQQMVHKGELTVQGALRLLRDVRPDKLDEVIATARINQQDADISTVIAATSNGRMTDEEGGQKLYTRPKTIQIASVNSAVADTPDACINKARVLTRIEILDAFKWFKRPQCPPYVAAYAEAFLTMAASGSKVNIKAWHKAHQNMLDQAVCEYRSKRRGKTSRAGSA